MERVFAPGWRRNAYQLQLGFSPVGRRGAQTAGPAPGLRGAYDDQRRAQITVVPPSTTSSMPLT